MHRCVILGKIAHKIEIRKEIHYPINYLSIICHCEAATSAAAVLHCSHYQLTPATAVYKYYQYSLNAEEFAEYHISGAPVGGAGTGDR